MRVNTWNTFGHRISADRGSILVDQSAHFFERNFPMSVSIQNAMWRYIEFQVLNSQGAYRVLNGQPTVIRL
jgi:hypothetical protein